MIVLVCGGRDLPLSYLPRIEEALLKLDPTVVIQGGAKGADQYARTIARNYGWESITVPADWTKHGRAAGPIRNQQMLKHNPDVVLAFPGGKGTADMVHRARNAGITVLTPS